MTTEWESCLIDASRSTHNEFCFVRVETVNKKLVPCEEFTVFSSTVPAKVVAITHEEGDSAASSWLKENQTRIQEAIDKYEIFGSKVPTYH